VFVSDLEHTSPIPSARRPELGVRHMSWTGILRLISIASSSNVELRQCFVGGGVQGNLGWRGGAPIQIDWQRFQYLEHEKKK